ncbi:conserved hypothetical protein [Coccidioides posadasii str. Silveira]|uniref:Uncharacterized protein n=1 Tax=Coccidioides posadasii (strain RMSCC 757 / Silveira) TaxID=443226 RepID=E9CX07_COCPS|nr:conserved hypothetical protein [Coccidioides posadasii str. Silveira]
MVDNRELSPMMTHFTKNPNNAVVSAENEVHPREFVHPTASMTQAITCPVSSDNPGLALLLTLLLQDPHPASVSPFWPRSLISSLGATLEGREAVPTYTLNRLWGLLFRNGAVKSAWLCTSQNPAITVSLSWICGRGRLRCCPLYPRPSAQQPLVLSRESSANQPYLQPHIQPQPSHLAPNFIPSCSLSSNRHQPKTLLLLAANAIAIQFYFDAHTLVNLFLIHAGGDLEFDHQNRG